MDLQENKTSENFLDHINYSLKKSYRRKNKMKIILRLYILIGLLSAIFGILYFLSSFYELEMNITQRMSLITAGVGLFIAISAKFFMEINKEREKELEEKNNDLALFSSFILNWTNLERAANFYLQDNQIQNNKFSIGKNLRMLKEKGILNTRDFLTLEKALDVRNKIVHQGMFSDKVLVDKLNKEVEKITNKIIDHPSSPYS